MQKHAGVNLRKRNVFITTILVLTSLLWVLSDPRFHILENLPFGAGLISTLTSALTSVIGIGLLHLFRKNMMDYSVADFRKLGEFASTEATGAGLYSVAVAIKTLAYALIIVAAII